MFCQLFGKFLIEKEVISQDTYKSIMEKLSDSRAKLGVIAVADGIITEKQADEINHLQTTKDARFGEIAVGEGYMTEEQLDVLLKKQGSAYAIFLSVLSEAADISVSKVDELLKEYDELVYIPMSSGLSGTCQTAAMVADDYDGKVQVVNNQRISVTMRQSVLDAKELAKRGKFAAEIKEILEKHKMESSIYITLDTLKYLKKGGRITPAAAAIGTMLKLNPVLQIQGEKLDAFAKARGKASAKKIMLKAMQDDLDTRFAEFAKDGKMHMEVAYSGNPEEAEEWAALVKETFPQFDFHMDPLSLSVACHIGHGALAIATSAYLPELD